jgi:hypothetical protein
MKPLVLLRACLKKDQRKQPRANGWASGTAKPKTQHPPDDPGGAVQTDQMG